MDINDLRYCPNRKWEDDDDPRCALLIFAGESGFNARDCHPCNAEDCPMPGKFAYRRGNGVAEEVAEIVRKRGF